MPGNALRDGLYHNLSFRGALILVKPHSTGFTLHVQKIPPTLKE
jgi:hypothetical protein